MASIEVRVRGSLDGDTVAVRPILLPDVPNTRISNSLATSLGLTQCRDVYVSNDFECLKWKISLFPIRVWFRRGGEYRSIAVYPIINGGERDAYYHMVLGGDAFAQLPDIHTFNTLQGSTATPTPGPGFNPRSEFSAALRLSDYSEIPRLNEFIEYSCVDSTAIRRLALNKVTRQMAVVYRISADVYCYYGVSKQVEGWIEDGASLGQVAQEAKAECPCKVLDSFPDATLVKPVLSVRM